MGKLWQIYHEIIKNFGPDKLRYILRTQYSIDYSLSQIYRYGEDPETTGSPMPPELYVPITLITGDDSLLRYYVEACGRIIIKLPDCRIKSARYITREIAKTLTECAEVVETSSKAIMDGILTIKEKSIIEKQIGEAHVQLARLSEVIKHG